MLSEILVCPVCRGTLDDLLCSDCDRAYRSAHGVPDLTPIPPPDGEVQNRWGMWEALQANGEQAYDIDPPSSLSVGDRDDVRAFARFAQLGGRVLDVGCGPQTLPSYAAGMTGQLVGIDPLVGEQPRDFAFVKGIAEYLPFADATFDRVLFATSLDHVLSPALAIAEARRVTARGGAVIVWFGEQAAPPSLAARAREAARMLRRGELAGIARAAREALQPRSAQNVITVETPAATMTFEVPEGAVDAFHFAHPDAPAIMGWLGAAGLTIEAVDRPIPGHCFIRARRRD
ncbi:MAG TPA: methyltransferase domain-containing protein [Solirubrobacteraceae bacterium]|nr:methyltransferase domain-containing protein [Solirubrobacteraceae bacterium]